MSMNFVPVDAAGYLERHCHGRGSLHPRMSEHSYMKIDTGDLRTSHTPNLQQLSASWKGPLRIAELRDQ